MFSTQSCVGTSYPAEEMVVSQQEAGRKRSGVESWYELIYYKGQHQNQFKWNCCKTSDSGSIRDGY